MRSNCGHRKPCDNQINDIEKTFFEVHKKQPFSVMKQLIFLISERKTPFGVLCLNRDNLNLQSCDQIRVIPSLSPRSQIGELLKIWLHSPGQPNTGKEKYIYIHSLQKRNRNGICCFLQNIFLSFCSTIFCLKPT